MALMITPDGTRTPITGDGEGGRVDLQQLYRLIGCDLVEHIDCDPKATGGYDGCYFDEMGKLKAALPNPDATAMCTWIAFDDVIVGTAIFVNTDDDGYSH